MQLDIPTTDPDFTIAPELDDYNLGLEITKSLTISAVQTGGVVAGFFVAAYAYDAGVKLYKRFWKKGEETPVVTDLPKATEN